MYLKNKDLMLLLDIDTYILKTINKNNKNSNKAKMLHDELTTLLYQLLNTKKQTNKKNYERIKEKRKTNKNYARSKKGIIKNGI